MVIITLAGNTTNKRCSGSGRCSKSLLTFNSKNLGTDLPCQLLKKTVRHYFLSPGKKTIEGIMNVTLSLSLKFKSVQACSY